jgi:hypothetical protein
MDIVSNPLFWLSVLVLAVLVLVLYFVKRAGDLRTRFFQQLEELSGSGTGQARVLESSGHLIRIDYFAGGRNSPSRLGLITRISAPGSFQLEKRGVADSIFEGLGLEGKIATSDSQFDSRCHIVSDEAEFAAAYFGSAKKRAAVEALFGEGCTRIELDEAGLQAVWTPFQIKEGTSVEFIKRSLAPLAVLAEEFPQGLPPAPPSGLSKRQFDRAFGFGLMALMAAYILLPLAAGIMGFIPLDRGKVFLDSLRYSGPALGIFLFLVIPALKGKSWFPAAILKTALFALVFFLLAGYWGEVCVNSRLDDAPPRAHQEAIIQKYQTHSRNSTGYHVVMRSWRPGRATEELRVSGRAYQAVEPGHSLATVLTKPGYLGHEWVVSYRFDSCPGGACGPQAGPADLTKPR